MSVKLYKGYIPTRGKKSIVSFRNKSAVDLLTYEQAENLPEFAGVLDDDTILIDIDEPEQAKKLLNIVTSYQLKCKVYRTTRGAHFLFKNNGNVTTNKTHCKLAVGLTADIKIGARNSYEVLKLNGVFREVIYDCEEYQIVPKYLTPITTKINILENEIGSRNQTLFSYIIPLQSADFTVSEIKECIRLINEYIFDESLSESEINTILRDEAFGMPNFFTSKGKFLFDRFANYIRNNSNVIKINGNLHIYQNGLYVNSYQLLESEMIKYIPNLNKSKRQEVLFYLEILIKENMRKASANYIAFANGVYNLIDSKMEEYSPSLVMTNKISYDYNENAYSELVDNVLNKMACNDKGIRSLMEEMIGYCFYTRNELGMAFVLLGDKSNGKSTFLDMVKNVLGDENIASLDLSELNTRFKTAELYGKLANIGDDIGDEFITDESIFKKLVTGDRINVERKYGNPFEFNNYSKLLFSANNMPRFKDKTGAVKRRLIIIPFNATFSKADADFDPFIKYKLREKECMEYLVKIGMEGLKRVLENRRFTISEKIIEEMNRYEKDTDPLITFLEEVEEYRIVNNSTKDVYRQYTVFCLTNNLKPMSNIEFSKTIRKRLDLEIVDRRIDGKKCRIFVKQFPQRNSEN